MRGTCLQLFRFASVAFCLILASCGGGGGGGGGSSGAPADQFTTSTAALNFTADIDSATPASQSITGTVTNVNTPIRVDVVIIGTAIASADFNLSGTNSGTLNVVPKAPADLGVGTHTDKITVYVCTDLAGCVGSPTQLSGSPKVVNVTYTVTATPQVRYVAPWVAQAGVMDKVIIRGVGFSLLTAPSVDFGGYAATAVTVINDTEIHATYPALNAGVYTVNVSDAAGAISTSANLYVMAEPALGYAFISALGEKTRILYDAVRDAIYVANKGNGQVVRYAHSTDAMTGDPVWTPTALDMAGLTDIAFAPDGATLLATGDNWVQQVNLDTFTITSFTSASLGPITYFGNIGMANDGIGFVAPRINGSGSTWIYKYNLRKKTIDTVFTNVSQGSVGVSGDGSKLLIASNVFLSTNIISEYNATTGQLGTSPINDTGAALPMDMTGNTVMLGLRDNSNDQHKIYRGSSLLGTVPGSSNMNINFASALSSDGNTFYMFDPYTAKLMIYDLNSSNGAGGFNQTAASPVSLASVSTGVAPNMALTPFGRTIFIVGGSGIIVQPLP